MNKQAFDAVIKLAEQGLADVDQFLPHSQLMGSRGRAMKYGRPQPEGRDYDYVAFTDDQQKQRELMRLLRNLAPSGYRLIDRPGGFLTASSNNMDLSVYPTAKQTDIYKAWELQENGLSKDEAWAQIDAEKNKTASEVRGPILISGHSGAGKSTLADALAKKLSLPVHRVDDHPAFAEFMQSPRRNNLLTDDTARQELDAVTRQSALETLQRAGDSGIVEGTQLGSLSPAELSAYSNRVHVSTPLRRLLQQRVERNRQKRLADGRPWNDDIKQERIRSAREIHSVYADSQRRFAKSPGTVRYRLNKDDIDSLLQQLQTASA